MDFRAARNEADELHRLAEERGWRANGPDETALTLLTTLGPVATKTVRADGIDDYGRAARFQALPVSLAGIGELADLLRHLGDCPHTLVIADSPRDGLDLAEPVHRDKDHFPGCPGRAVLMLDIDDAQAPDGMDPTSREAVRWIREQLPDGLRTAACVAQFTTKAGMTEAAGRVKVHLWFLLDRRADAAGLKAWAKAYREQEDALALDMAALHPVQALYTAAPIFQDRPDPFAGRSRVLLLEGDRERVSVDALESYTEAHAPEHQQRERASTPEDYAPPPCGWTGRASDYLTDDALGLHRSITRLTWEFARERGENAHPEQVGALADHIRTVALKNADAGLLTGRSAEYIEGETTFEQIHRAYRGAVDKGACLRRPESAPRNFTDAMKALAQVAAGKRESGGYSAQDWAYNAAMTGLSRLGPMTVDSLLDQVAGAAGRKLDSGIRRVLERHWVDQERETDRLNRPPRGAQVIDGLDQVEIPPGAIVAVRAPHGTGKTKIIAGKAIEQHQHTMVISHRVSLTQGHSARLSPLFGIANYRDGAKIGNLLTDGTATTANSLPKVLQKLVDADAEPVSCVVIDEAVQVLRHIAGGGVSKREKARILSAMRDLLSRRDVTVVLLDADLDQFTVGAFADMAESKPVETYRLDREQPGTLRVFSDAMSRGSAPAAIADAMLLDLSEGRRVVLATDTKQEALAIGKRLQESGHRGGVITADTPGKERSAFDSAPDGYPQAQGWQFLIYSPAIAAGVSLESGYFDAVFGLYTGVVLPSDFMQMLLRVRTVRTWTVAVSTRAPGPSIELGEIEKALLGLDADEKGSKAAQELEEDSRLILSVQAREKQAKRWYALKLILLCERRGWNTERIHSRPQSELVAVELSEIIKVIRDARVDDVMNADLITDAEAEKLKRESKRTRAQDLSLARYLVAHTFRMEQEALTAADVSFYQKSQNRAREIIALFAAVCLEYARESWADLTKDEEELIALRQWLRPKALMFADLLRGLGADPITGDGSWTKADAAQVLPAVIQNHASIATVLGLNVTQEAKLPQEVIRRILAGGLGLVVMSEGPRRSPVYRLNPDALAQMIGYAARVSDKVARVLPDAEARIIEHVSTEAFFSNADLPRWAGGLLRTLGVVLVDRRWIEQQCGVSRATAKRYRKEAEGINAEGVRWWSVDLGSDDRGPWACVALTVADDPERVTALISHAARSRVEGCAKGGLKMVESPGESYRLSGRDDQNEPPLAHPADSHSAPVKSTSTDPQASQALIHQAARSRVVGCAKMVDLPGEPIRLSGQNDQNGTPLIHPADSHSAPVKSTSTDPQASQAPATTTTGDSDTDDRDHTHARAERDQATESADSAHGAPVSVAVAQDADTPATISEPVPASAPSTSEEKPLNGTDRLSTYELVDAVVPGPNAHAKAARLAERGRKIVRKIRKGLTLASPGELEWLDRWIGDKEQERLWFTALGYAGGDIRQAQEWVKNATRAALEKRQQQET